MKKGLTVDEVYHIQILAGNGENTVFNYDAVAGKQSVQLRGVRTGEIILIEKDAKVSAASPAARMVRMIFSFLLMQVLYTYFCPVSSANSIFSCLSESLFLTILAICAICMILYPSILCSFCEISVKRNLFLLNRIKKSGIMRNEENCCFRKTMQFLSIKKRQKGIESHD